MNGLLCSDRVAVHEHRGARAEEVRHVAGRASEETKAARSRQKQFATEESVRQKPQTVQQSRPQTRTAAQR